MCRAKDQIVSIIIPTYQRSHFLRRAIKSALASAPENCTEVIVVPNGQGTEWKGISDEFSSERRIKWHPISSANVGAARNHGIEMASGSFIRFLDDDDFFYPSACVRQYQSLIKESADICSGNINVLRESGSHIKYLTQPDTCDFFSSVACPSRCVQVGAHIFRKSLVENIKWNDALNVGEDVDWLFNVAGSRDLNWHKIDESVSAWVQHDGLRLSRGHDPGDATLKYLASSLLIQMNMLERLGRLDEARRLASVDGLWSFFQKGFRYDRKYWRSVAQLSESYYPGRRPPSAIYRLPVAKSISPVLTETLLIPVRNIFHPVRVLLDYLGINRA